MLLAAAAELALRTGTRVVEPWLLLAAFPGDDIVAAAVELRERGLIQLALGDGPAVVLLALTNAGVLHHLVATRPDLADVRARLAAATTLAAGRGPVDLAGAAGEPRLLVECLLDSWVADRLLTYSPAPGGLLRVHRISGRLPGAAAAAPEPAPGEASPAEPAAP